MKAINYENREARDNTAVKRSLMYSQIFNYNMNRDGTRSMDVSAAVAGGGKSITSKKNYYIGIILSLLVIALCFWWSYAHDSVAEIINNFLLEQNDVAMQLTEPEAVEFELDAFLEVASKNHRYSDDVENYYYKNYGLWSEVPLSDGIKEHVADDATLRFSYYKLAVYEDSKIGKVEITIIDEDAGAIDDLQYDLSGTFKIAGYSEESTVLADKGNLATFVHEAENGEKAYFIRNWTYGNYSVYFETENIVFEMEIPASNKAVKNAKQIFEAVAG